ncbi:trypsin alpha-3 [Drosophila sechellia]|uniref:trypsin n=1 Tax=Drosophila sechellia TaxID=7238 RepID=B4I2H4_DROSE|nr:trypsin alpha-3 [Drosophila sechellia]EDW53969.1 GM18246 [Drosophila sechellia]
MFVQWIFLVFSVTLVSSKWTPERIVGGDQISILSVPWQASILWFGKHYCGAAIYSEDIVITAAHCLTGYDSEFLSVRVGSSYTLFGGQVVGVSSFLLHEDYGRSLSNDIAVMRLQSKLRLGTGVSVIPLADTSPASGSPAIVSGWGAIGYKKKYPKSILSASVSIVDHDQCRRSYGRKITKDMICAAAPGKDACSGDSGGPLVSGNKLVGIVSFGKECAHSKFPGVYANVAELKPWILGAIERINNSK